MYVFPIILPKKSGDNIKKAPHFRKRGTPRTLNIKVEYALQR